MLSLSLVSSVPAAEEAVGQFTRHADIGDPAIGGATSYDPLTQHYRMAAGGANIWGASDQFQFAWNRMKGDFIVRARVAFLGQGADPHRKYGWMARASLDADAPYVDACVHGDGLASLQYRKTKGGGTAEVKLKLAGGDVVQLERRGDTFVFSSARYGETFESAELELPLGEELAVGLFLCAHHPAAREQAVFRDVRLVRPAPVGFKPYRDYIGCQLEVLNVHTGRLLALDRSAEPYEAPNWTRDGHTLIVNVSGTSPDKGRLRTYDLRTGRFAPLDTGEIRNNNNDHVLSFDGAQLGISSYNPETRGSSGYTLPATGGRPTLITSKSPSYLHGWSPDAQWLVFTGGRGDNFDIYKIRATGGDEIRLTDAPGLDDGPEYSPDGAWIYFNSARTGRMQLWRMKPDGSAPEQLTHDDFNNWFPHVSPDGRWLAFITFGPEVKADDHPYYQRVYLRMMPAGGGTPRVIAYVYGGQGTLNVPSWSPDSTRIAFVSNTQVE